MKQLIFYLLFLLLAVSADAQTPNSGNANRIEAQVDITATVIQSIELITVNSMTFGINQVGQEEEIYVNPVNDNTAGFMIAKGTPGAEFRLEFEPEKRLSHVEGVSFLTFTYEISGNTIEEQSTSELLDINERTLRFNDEGRYYLWVGGQVDLKNAIPGSYEGDFTIEINYI